MTKFCVSTKGSIADYIAKSPSLNLESLLDATTRIYGIHGNKELKGTNEYT